MGLDKVKDEVVKKTEEQKNAVIDQGKEEAANIMKSAKKTIDNKQKEADADLEKVTAHMQKTEIASAELEVKKMLLEEKKVAAEDVFETAKEQLAELSDEKRKEHIKKLLEMANKEIEVASVYCNKKDVKLVHGAKTKEADIAGGIIAENKAHTISVDYSYETILQNIKEKSIREVAEILFQ
ncbi:MAG: hypothetical protein GY861_07505 [bacterium]|nr:hypothetical protein [bacterium]